MKPIDYLLVGHVTLDVLPQGSIPGGTVSYAGRTAHALGCRTAALTSAGPAFDFAAALPGVAVHNMPAPETTTFTNTYTPQGRVQTVHHIAAPLAVGDLPDAWRSPRIVHLGPVANEVDRAFVRAFPKSIIGITPQGWMRTWDGDGRVSACIWPQAAAVLPFASVVIISREDLLYEAMLAEFCRLSPLVILTDGAAGCTLYRGNESRHVAAPAVTEIDPTGAGDIFAAAFLTYFAGTGGDPWEAARRANIVAAASVTASGLDEKLAAMRSALDANRITA